jgi:hypothetical protein
MHIKPPIPRMNSPNYKQRIIRKDCTTLCGPFSYQKSVIRRKFQC